MTEEEIRVRLEEIRREIEAERVSMGELIELEALAEHIEEGDVLLLEWAGVPESRCLHNRVEMRQIESWGYNATLDRDGTVVVDYGAGDWAAGPDTDSRTVVCIDCLVEVPYKTITSTDERSDKNGEAVWA